MFKSHLVLAWRNIRRNPVYSALNVFGLAVGLAVFILIMLFVRTELGYDHYHANARNIYKVIQEQPGNYFQGSNVFAVTPGPLAAAMVRDFPEVRAAARFNNWTDALVTVGEATFFEKKITWTDPEAFEIFSFPLVRGDRTAVLRDPASMLFSETAARRLFGAADPVGRTVAIEVYGLKAEFVVEGVFRDLPSQSHFTMDIVAPFETLGRLQTTGLADWSNSSYHTYVLLEGRRRPGGLGGEAAGLPREAPRRRRPPRAIHPRAPDPHPPPLPGHLPDRPDRRRPLR